MTGESECVFCRIVSGEADARILYEDERVVAFRDIHPVAPVHILIVPRRHVPSLNEADDPDLLGHMLTVARELAVGEGVSERGYRTLFNCQRDGGQVVFHLHLHLLGGRRLGPMG